MNKKQQLLLSVAVISLAIILIPVSIFAANFLTVGISNKIIFIVEDIEGSFSYKISGNSNPENDIQYSPGNVFVAKYVENEDRYVLKNSENEEISSTITLDKPVGGLRFDSDNKIITYTFVFINHGQNNVKISVDSDQESENSLILNGVETRYFYELFYSEIDEISQIPAYSENVIIPPTKYFETIVSKKTNNIYNYIVFSYELKVLDSQNEYFKTNLKININLSSQTEI